MNNYDEIERKIFLIKNYLEDNLSVAEEEELRVWLDESPKHRETFQRIRDKKILFAKLEYRQRQETETVSFQANLSLRQTFGIRLP